MRTTLAVTLLLLCCASTAQAASPAERRAPRRVGTRAGAHLRVLRPRAGARRGLHRAGPAAHERRRARRHARRDAQSDRARRGRELHRPGRLDKTLAQIKTCDAGCGSTRPSGPRPRYVGCPTLEEVFQRYGKPVNYYIETKTAGARRPAWRRSCSRCSTVRPARSRRRRDWQVLIQSFSADSLRIIHAHRSAAAADLPRQPRTSPTCPIRSRVRGRDRAVVRRRDAGVRERRRTRCASTSIPTRSTTMPTCADARRSASTACSPTSRTGSTCCSARRPLPGCRARATPPRTMRACRARIVGGGVAGTVPATLSLTMGAAPTFGTFVPGVAQEYTASTTATVVSSAGNAALTVTDPSTVAPGHLVNGGVLPCRAAAGRWVTASRDAQDVDRADQQRRRRRCRSRRRSGRPSRSGRAPTPRR